MTLYHRNLTLNKWSKFSLAEQMANIGAEVGRAINWQRKDHHNCQLAFFRALELIDLTKADLQQKRQWAKLKEICRLREVLADYFVGENLYGSSNILWEKYFYPFGWAARVNHQP